MQVPQLSILSVLVMVATAVVLPVPVAETTTTQINVLAPATSPVSFVGKMKNGVKKVLGLHPAVPYVAGTVGVLTVGAGITTPIVIHKARQTKQREIDEGRKHGVTGTDEEARKIGRIILEKQKK